MSGLVISPRYRLSVGEVRLHGRCGAVRRAAGRRPSGRAGGQQCNASQSFRNLANSVTPGNERCMVVRADCLATIYY